LAKQKIPNAYRHVGQNQASRILIDVERWGGKIAGSKAVDGEEK
jgi:hypothetical protein